MLNGLKKMASAALAVGLVLLAVSCTDKGSTSKGDKTVVIDGLTYNISTTACSLDSDCSGTGAVCYKKLCATPAETNPLGCTSDEECTDTDKPVCSISGECVAVSDPNLPECTTEKACSDGKECKDGLCVDVVTPATDRKIGESCDDTHTCVATLACTNEKCVATNDYVIPFVDPVLIAMINQKIDPARADDALITVKDCANITDLGDRRVVSTPISNISGIEFCGKLAQVSLQMNQITDIKPLAGLTGLTSLSLSSNQITDIKPLAGLTGLTSLSLSSNQITDIKPLAGMTGLIELNLYDNQITDIKPLAGLTGLTYLILSHNQITDIKPLAGLTGLTYLGLSYNQITDIKTLAGMTGLIELDLSANQITDIKPLAGLTGLTYLILYNNQITDIKPLAGLTGLRILGLNYNQITDIKPLAGLTGLRILGLLNNDIASLAPLAELNTNGGLKSGSKLLIDKYPTNAKPGTTNFYNNFILNTLIKNGVTVYHSN